ncbi:hypothetical protein ACGF12_22890 [Kitasatospora sp. NPDC048296]|uniref:hypothetical protein n=1 Tax=Kitasatospora sp. NPDC048296 TaxID=3364048 RepID=UPI003714685C
MNEPRHRLPELLHAAAGFLDRLDGVAGLRAGLHPRQAEGVRLLVRTGLPYTDEVGPLDRIAAALNAPVDHERVGCGGHARVRGVWDGMPVYASHLYFDEPDSQAPCTQQAAELGRRVRALIPWSARAWARQAESVHVYDEAGTPCVRVVLRSEGLLDQALAGLLDETGSLQYRHAREHDFVAHGSVLLEDGTVVTTSVITP